MVTIRIVIWLFDNLVENKWIESIYIRLLRIYIFFFLWFITFILFYLPTPTLPTTHTHKSQKNPHPHPQYFLPTNIYPHPHPQLFLCCGTRTHNFIYTHNRHTIIMHVVILNTQWMLKKNNYCYSNQQ